ncbi:MAG TPA: hypothetical protein VK582_04655 [Pyrinomonadaceae bacterium]|nr:hypothetical protein [Pyrinomonadaceae bacterium]
MKRSKFGCTAAIRTPDARNPPRGSDTAHSTYPIVISPRGTDLLTTRPTIRWSAPARSSVETSYNVSIDRDGQPVWPPKTVKGTELVYPANEPELTPGLYLVVVSTSTGSSDEEQVTDRGFVVFPQCREPNLSRATPCKRNKIREEVQRLRAPNFPAKATSF